MSVRGFIPESEITSERIGSALRRAPYSQYSCPAGMVGIEVDLVLKVEIDIVAEERVLRFRSLLPTLPVKPLTASTKRDHRPYYAHRSNALEAGSCFRACEDLDALEVTSHIAYEGGVTEGQLLSTLQLLIWSILAAVRSRWMRRSEGEEFDYRPEEFGWMQREPPFMIGTRQDWLFQPSRYRSPDQ